MYALNTKCRIQSYPIYHMWNRWHTFLRRHHTRMRYGWSVSFNNFQKIKLCILFNFIHVFCFVRVCASLSIRFFFFFAFVVSGRLSTACVLFVTVTFPFSSSSLFLSQDWVSQAEKLWFCCCWSCCSLFFLSRSSILLVSLERILAKKKEHTHTTVHICFYGFVNNNGGHIG